MELELVGARDDFVELLLEALIGLDGNRSLGQIIECPVEVLLGGIEVPGSVVGPPFLIFLLSGRYHSLNRISFRSRLLFDLDLGSRRRSRGRNGRSQRLRRRSSLGCPLLPRLTGGCKQRQPSQNQGQEIPFANAHIGSEYLNLDAGNQSSVLLLTDVFQPQRA